MSDNNWILYFILLLSLFSISYATLTNNSYGQLGCCTNSGENQCRPNANCTPGLGNTCQVTEAVCLGDNGGNVWTVGLQCVITDGPNRQCGDNGPCCQEVAPPTGCCQVGDMCTPDLTQTECTNQGGTYGGDDVQCGTDPCVAPTGCCVCGDSECSITTEAECSDMEGCVYQGDDTVCEGKDECSDVPGCCFLDANGGGTNLANRQIDPNKCIETTASMCNLDGGAFQGVGTSCIDFPEECFFPARNVPTLSQWSMITLAGLLSTISLLVIIRRRRFNIS